MARTKQAARRPGKKREDEEVEIGQAGPSQYGPVKAGEVKMEDPDYEDLDTSHYFKSPSREQSDAFTEEYSDSLGSNLAARMAPLQALGVSKSGKKLTDPVDKIEDKWELLPAFLQVKGLVKQHIDSFNYFVETDLKNIVKANDRVTSDIDPNFYLEYTDIWVGRPERNDVEAQRAGFYPQECRLRDMTYSAPIFVNIFYWRSGRKVRRKGVNIGKLPIMLRSNRCWLSDKSEKELATMNECPLDPGGYFVVKGTEKVILVQEQLSKNRIILEADTKKGTVSASVTSSTHERKSKSYVLTKHGKIYMKHNSIREDIPIVIVFKALGVQADKEILQLVAGNDEAYKDLFAISLEEAARAGRLHQATGAQLHRFSSQAE